MEIKLSITKSNIKSIILWIAFILFFLFSLSLTLESYAEYEYKAGDIFLAISVLAGVIGLGLFLYSRIKSRVKTPSA